MRHAARMQRASEGRPIRWGILGTGRVAGRFAQALRELDDARLLAAGSRRLATAEAFARHHGVERAYGSYAQLAADPDLDIVYVASPHALHREHSLLCLEAGRAVLCEKPFALNATEAREVIASARSRGLFCMEAMWTRFLPAMRRLTELVDAGAIGELRMVTAQLGFPSEPDPSSRLFDPALGGGALLDLGVYPLALASQLLGRPGRGRQRGHARRDRRRRAVGAAAALRGRRHRLAGREPAQPRAQRGLHRGQHRPDPRPRAAQPAPGAHCYPDT